MSGSSGTPRRIFQRRSEFSTIAESERPGRLHPYNPPMSLLARYTRWLHTRWPAGTVERLPEAREDGTTTLRGVRIVGDLTGGPLLKLSSDGGARAVRAILAESDFRSATAENGVLDLAIVGGGVAGIAAAIEA